VREGETQRGRVGVFERMRMGRMRTKTRRERNRRTSKKMLPVPEKDLSHFLNSRTPIHELLQM